MDQSRILLSCFACDRMILPATLRVMQENRAALLEDVVYH